MISGVYRMALTSFAAAAYYHTKNATIDYGIVDGFD
jgi:hypothetical protein